MYHRSVGGLTQDFLQKIEAGEFSADDVVWDLRHGRGELLALILEIYEPLVQKWGKKWLRNLPASDFCPEDFSQDLWIKVQKALMDGKFWRNQNGAGFKTWLYSLAHNLAMDQRRAYNRRVSIQAGESGNLAELWEGLNDPQCACPEDVTRFSLREKLTFALSQLKDEEKILLLNVHVKRVPVKKMAHEKGKSLSTVYAQIDRAEKRLKLHFSQI